MKMFFKYMAVATLALSVSQPSFAADDRIRSITVKGEARDFVVPDQAKITLTIHGKNAQLAAAKKQHDGKLTKVLKLFKEHKIPKSKIRTQQTSTRPLYRYDKRTRKQISEGYQVQTTLVVTLEKTQKLGPLLESISQAGIEEKDAKRWGQFMRVHYELSNPNAVRDRLLADAIGNARKKAKRMAAAAGAGLDDVLQISENNISGFHPRPHQFAGAEMVLARSADAAPTPPAGEHEVKAHVTVTFELD